MRMRFLGFWVIRDKRAEMLLIGLMSGTSVDGIDAALVEIEGAAGDWRLVVREFLCVPWPSELRAAILDSCRPDAPIRFVTALNYLLGEEFAGAAFRVAESAGVELGGVAAI